MQMLQQLNAEHLICWLLLLLLDYACSDSLHMQMLRQLRAEQLICWLLLLLLDYAYSDS